MYTFYRNVILQNVVAICWLDSVIYHIKTIYSYKQVCHQQIALINEYKNTATCLSIYS